MEGDCGEVCVKCGEGMVCGEGCGIGKVCQGLNGEGLANGTGLIRTLSFRTISHEWEGIFMERNIS